MPVNSRPCHLRQSRERAQAATNKRFFIPLVAMGPVGRLHGPPAPGQASHLEGARRSWPGSFFARQAYRGEGQGESERLNTAVRRERAGQDTTPNAISEQQQTPRKKWRIGRPWRLRPTDAAAQPTIAHSILVEMFTCKGSSRSLLVWYLFIRLPRLTSQGMESLVQPVLILRIALYVCPSRSLGHAARTTLEVDRVLWRRKKNQSHSWGPSSSALRLDGTLLERLIRHPF